MIFKLISKLTNKILTTNILDYKLTYKKLIETNIKFKIINS